MNLACNFAAQKMKLSVKEFFSKCVISVCNFQFMKSPVELNSLSENCFISLGLMRDETGGLANETYFSNSIVS